MNLFFRIIFFCFGLVLALDAILPTRTQTLTISDHFVSSSNKGRSDHYKLAFNDATVSSCTVSEKNYERLQNGDQVVVHSSRFIKNCIKIEHKDQVIKNKSYWRWLGILLGAGFIAYGIGWIKPEKWLPAR